MWRAYDVAVARPRRESCYPVEPVPSPNPFLARVAVLGVVLAAGACAKATSPVADGETDGSGGASTNGAGGAGGKHTTSSSSSTTDTTSTSTTSTTANGGAGGSGEGGAGLAGGGQGGAGPGGGGQGGAPPGPCVVGHLLVSEIRSRGAAGAGDEFVELYNATGSAVTLDDNWTLDARSTASAKYTTRWTGKGDVIPAHGHFLIVGSSYAQSPAKDDGLASGITDASSVRLSKAGATVDVVCFAFDAKTLAAFDATYDCEGTPASNLPHNDGSGAQSNTDASIERRPGGAAGNCTDTNDSSADFVAAAPSTPLNSQSAPAP